MNRKLTVWLAAGCVLLTTGTTAGDYFMTDIVDAAKRGDAHAVHKLLEQDVKQVEATDEAGYTALHWAGIRGYWRIFRELLEAGAPVGAVGGDGGTPLHWACHHDRPDMVRLLLDAGAEVDAGNRWGRTPLHVATRRGCRQVAELLLDAGADLTAATKEGWTPLHVAYRSGQDGLVELLRIRGADPDCQDQHGQRPADVARRRPPAIAIAAATLDDYIGIYDLGDGATVKVWREGEQLRLREYAPDDLYPIGEDLFRCRQEPWQVRFGRDQAGDISSIELDYLRRTVSGTRTSTPRYVGSQACKSCHLSREDPTYLQWLQSRHAHAYWRLGADWAMFLARLRPQYHDLESPMQDERCLLCHVTGAQDPDNLFAASYRPEEGVTCEACHGPGSHYLDPEVMADRESFLAHGGVVPDETTCRRCHRNSERFDFATWSPKVAHRPAADQG